MSKKVDIYLLEKINLSMKCLKRNAHSTLMWQYKQIYILCLVKQRHSTEAQTNYETNQQPTIN